MARLFALLLLSLLAVASMAQRSPLKLKPGDKLGIQVFGVQNYDGEFAVLTDGSINGRGFGRIVVEGKTLDEVRSLVKSRLEKVMKNPIVTVLVLGQQVDVVFVSGIKAQNSGAFPLLPDMNLRQLLATLDLPDDADKLQARLFHVGEDADVFNVGEVLKGTSTNPKLRPSDVITILPLDFVRVWMSGLVAKPGELRIQQGSDIYQAVAAAGGASPDLLAREDAEIILRRGTDSQVVSLRQDPQKPAPKLEAGDTVIIQAPALVKVTVSGEVKTPGEVVLKQHSTLEEVVARSGGITPDGTMENVLILRRGETLQFNGAIHGESVPKFEIEDGDVVYVRRNERTVVVVGSVTKPGLMVMLDNRPYRLADALAWAGGITDKGTNHRVYLGRPDSDGKMKVTIVALDKYLKDGDLGSNPELKPGDVVLFGDAKGITLGNAQQILSSAVLFLNIIKR